MALIAITLFAAVSLEAAELSDAAPFQVTSAMRGRPDPEGTPTPVKIGVYILDVYDIDDVEQTFTAEFAYRLQWRDERLAAGLAEGETRRFGMEEVWRPNVLVFNGRGLESQVERFIEVDAQGNVSLWQRDYGDLAFRLNLRDFPFDTHHLPIIFVSGRYGPEAVRFEVDRRFTGESEELAIADWMIRAAEPRLDGYHFAPQGRDLSMAVFRIEATRRVGFFVWRVIAPLMLIVFMSWMVFWIDPNHLEAQVGVSATSVLTLVAFQFALGVLLPRIAYLTRIDIFILITSLLVFLALVEGVVTSGLAGKGRHETALRIDWWSRRLFPTVYVVASALTFLL